MAVIYIGIDDTDIIGGPGTGRIARDLGTYLESLGKGSFKAVVRHQLLVDPRIPYTSHNSAKCILFDNENKPLEIMNSCEKFIAEHFQEGSDPGVCIATAEQATDELLAFGVLALKEYIPKLRAVDLADRTGILLKELGGTGDGIIGALAAAALSISGNDGRYVQLRGIKEIQGLITVAQIKERTDTVKIVDEEGNIVPDAEIVDSMGWLRPSRRECLPILRVRLETDNEGNKVWRPIERKLKSHVE